MTVAASTQAESLIAEDQVWYNPNGYFSLTVKAFNGSKVTLFSPGDPRDFPRELDKSYVENNWILIR